MSEETISGNRPPARKRPASAPPGADVGPLCEPGDAGPPTRVGLPDGDGWAWLVTRHDDVRAVADDPRFSRVAVTDRRAGRPAPHPVGAGGAAGFPDTPDHIRLRRGVAAVFSASGVERRRERCGRMLGELVEEMLQDGPPADLTEAVLGPFPVAVICELMGVPPADRQGMHAWTRQILSSSHGADAGERARKEMAAYFSDLIGLREGSTGEDVASLLGAALGRAELTLDEATGCAVGLQVGGEAVTHMSSRLFRLLLSRPELAERLRAEPGIRPRAVDELLRRICRDDPDGPRRIALEDVEIGGVRVRAGEVVQVSYAAANHDPVVFPDPEAIDVDRDPNPHLTFGSGPHHCPGGALARMELELLADALLDGVPGLRLAVPAEAVSPGRNTPVGGPEALPVTW
ncbi:cytochrome P450 [Streptomyces sp. NPDC050698]